MRDEVVCIPNIGPRERRTRLVSGLVMLAMSAAIGIALVAIDANPLWRLIVFLPLYGAASGVFQWSKKT